MEPLELWGGVECTVNRVGDVYFDQVRRSGHHDRPDDIDLFASLGIHAIRYPVVWERVAPVQSAERSWAWSDDRLARLRNCRIRPVVTLLHHGSGPRYTDLLDPSFVELFAEFAANVATRYPWVTDFTPVNEPLTTARFSALYGHWYPHHADDRRFVRALLNQVRAMVRAMERIAEITPAARLIATEDAGRIDGTAPLTYQAEFENHRRWLTTDLLCGRVDPDHPLWNWLIGCGASPEELHWFLTHRWPPSIVGLNYYLTSDRFLDDRLQRYPGAAAAGNGRDRYVDVDAVRVEAADRPDHRRVLEDAWVRYRLPVALTEVHAGCTREEQMRWLATAWQAAEDARRHGTEVVAVTTWALLGSYDWSTLVTRADGDYEPGAFDVRSDPPRLTAVGRLARSLATGGRLHPVATQHGWWHRDSRPAAQGSALDRQPHAARSTRPVLIVGASGMVGRAFVRACAARGLDVVAFTHQQLDAADADAVSRAMFRLQPWAIVNAAGDTRLDRAETHQAACFLANTSTTEVLAGAAAAFHTRLLSFSTEHVFDGAAGRAYVETDLPAPRNVYGLSKQRAEQYSAAHCASALTVRTSVLFGGDDPDNFLTRALRELSGGRPVITADDLIVSPTYLPQMVDRALDLLIDGEQGIWHVVNAGAVSWAAFVSLAADLAGLDDRLVQGAPSARLDLTAARPTFAALASTRGQIMPTLSQGLGAYLAAAGGCWRERRRHAR